MSASVFQSGMTNPGVMGVPPNHLVWAILVTIFCCLPFGIVSIVYAAQVNSKVAAGDIIGAWQSSNSAKTWAWVAFGVGLVGGVLVVLLSAIGAADV